MKLILDIKAEKLNFLLELLRNFKFVNNIETIEDDGTLKKEQILSIEQGIRELNLVKAGKLEARNVEELFHEL